ncbi:MAG: major facilitator superfamily 1 [Myxococcaceae bacterium]|nr:major facilitator superfamily 1 [Myxococcaceae bacterium]
MQPLTSLWKPPLGRLTCGLALTVVATAFEALAVATILPATSAELGGLAWYGWTFSAFMLANLVGTSLGGGATDRRGPTLPFSCGTVMFASGLVVSGFAPSMPVIVAGRVLQGLGAGLLSSVSYACIARAYPLALQPRMLATLSSAWVIPGLVGPGLSAAIVQYAGWRWVFLGLAPLPLVAAVLVLPALHELPAEQTMAQPAIAGRAVQLALGMTALLAAPRLHSWGGGLALAAAGLALAARGFPRLMPEGTLAARAGLPAAVACMALITAAFFGTEAYLPLTLSRVRQQPILLIGSALTAASLTWTAGAWLPLRLTPRFGRRAVVQAGLALLVLGILATLSLLSARVPAWCAVLAWGLTGLGVGLSFTACSAAVLEAAPAGREGATSASLQLAQVLGAAVSTGVGGAVVAADFAGDPPVLGVALVDLIMVCVCLLGLVAARGLHGARAMAGSLGAGVITR